MAFLLCYSELGVVDWGRKAIYLDQSFYRLIFEYCTTHNGFTILTEIASLGYDGKLVLSRAKLSILSDELERLHELGSHRQLADLQAVVQAALDKKMELSVAGDMHPVLCPRT